MQPCFYRLGRIATTLALAATGCAELDEYKNGTICIYTTRPTDQAKREIADFLAKNPDVGLWCDDLEDGDYIGDRYDGQSDATAGKKLEWRVGFFSTGALIDRLESLAESERPDVIWSVGLSHIRTAAGASGASLPLHPYAPAATAKLIAEVSARSPGWQELFDRVFLDAWTATDSERKRRHLAPRYTGMVAYVVAMCVHTERLRALTICPEGQDTCDEPEKIRPYADWTPSQGLSWTDLTGPAFRGKIVMPRPDRTGSGLITYNAMTHYMPGFRFDQLDTNMALYTRGGADPCGVVASDPALVVGISYDTAVCTQSSPENGLDFVLPRDVDGRGQIPYDIEAVAIVEKPDIAPAAITFVDWAVSGDAMRKYAEFTTMTALSVSRDDPPQCFRGADTDRHWIGAGQSQVLGVLASERKDVTREWCQKFCGCNCDTASATDLAKTACIPAKLRPDGVCPPAK